MGYTARFSEEWQLIDVVYGVNVAAGAVTDSGYSDVHNFSRIVAIFHPVATQDAIDIDVEEGTTTAGAGVQSFDSGGKDVLISAADTAPSVIEIKGEEFDVNGAYDCLNFEMTCAATGGNGNYFVLEVWGEPYYRPAATTNLDSVTD